ncbi:MAG: hypothetical protein QG608_2325 [Actinomycetota bacterium]|nr:hypothetical protein [Actinomycetota bacterium]
MDFTFVVTVLNFFKNLYQRTVEFVKEHPGSSVLTMVVVVVSTGALSLVGVGDSPGGGTSSEPVKGPVARGTKINGIDIQGYCDSIKYLTGKLDVSDPDVPRVICFTRMTDNRVSASDSPVAISMIGACAYHYDLQPGQHFSFDYDDPADLYTGICYVEPGRHRAGGNGGMENLSGYCKGKYRNMAGVKARSDLLVNGEKGWSCSVSVEGATVCGAQHPNYENVVARYEDGELSCYGGLKG